ncbi:MAG TPA: DUF4382 domain-containing protein, partial [Nitrospiraceae bacterium]|nr:DUF4382 domain-containing protein [Nitrospiraceae bacterium]
LNPARKINLLDLNDPTQTNRALEFLGETPLEAGHYTQLRLVLAPNRGSSPPANSVVLSGQTTEIPLDTPSAVQSGIKLIHQFTVDSGQRVDLLLDFDACKSIVRTGNGKYKLKPLIKVIPFVLNGIDGFVDKTLLVNNVIVSAQVNGTIVRTTAPNSQTGEFFLAHLDPTNCPTTCYDVVITARNSPTDDCCATAVITGVPVPSSTSITTISTSGTPFTLHPSAFHAIAGTVSLINPPPPFPQPSVDDRDDGTVIVAAKQSLSGGPTVTVKTQVAMLKDDTATVGDYKYELVLPVAAPESASYGVGVLPITPSPNGQTGGVYTVYGSGQTPTTVYATQDPAPSSVDISGASATQDFTLTP